MIITSKRPLAIRIFAATFFLSALVAFLRGMNGLPELIAIMQAPVPVPWTNDLAIILLSARLSIALIPIALIWFLASSFARWAAAILALGKLINITAGVENWAIGGGIGPWWILAMALTIISIVMLFTPSANDWFKTKGAADAPVFE